MRLARVRRSQDRLHARGESLHERSFGAPAPIGKGDRTAPHAARPPWQLHSQGRATHTAAQRPGRVPGRKTMMTNGKMDMDQDPTTANPEPSAPALGAETREFSAEVGRLLDLV